MTLRRSRPFARPLPWLALAAAALLAVPGEPASAEDAAPGGAGMSDPPKPDQPKPPEPNAPAAPGAQPLPGAQTPPPEPVKLADGRIELNHLDEYLKHSKSDNQDILAAMDAVMKAYLGLVPTDDAGKTTFEADKEKFQKDVEDAFVKALQLVRVRPNSKSNERDDVNVKAAHLLGDTNKRVTKDIIDSLDTKIFKAKGYEPATAVYDEAFLAIARLNDHKTGFPYVLDWLKYDSTPGVVDRVKAAFDGIIHFKDVPGGERFKVIQQVTRNFATVESAANRGRTKDEQAYKRVWDKIKPSVIKALQVYAKEPKAPDGALIATVDGFTQWFREHDKPRDPAWADPRVVGEHAGEHK